MLETLRTPPSPSSFIPLSTHQSATPSTFFSSTPILHYHCPRASILASPTHLGALSLSHRSGTSGSTLNGHGIGEDDGPAAIKQILLPNVDIWVSTRHLTLYSTTTSSGIQIPYQNITLHAKLKVRLPDHATGEGEAPEVEALYIHVQPSTGSGDDLEEEDEDDGIEITVVADTGSAASTSSPLNEDAAVIEDEETESIERDGEERGTSIERLYKALTDCANLQPDESADGEEDGGGRIVFEGAVGYDSRMPVGSGIEGGITILGGNSTGEGEGGGLPPPMPGSGGWITAENVGDFFDEQGNWKSGQGPSATGGLGDGAGSRRDRDRSGDEDDQKKVEDGKWQRTG